jgi:hypothetical protein
MENNARDAAAGLVTNHRRSWLRRLFAVSAVVAVIAICAGAKADFLSGNDLYKACTSADEVSSSTQFGREACRGFVAAIGDTARANPIEGVMWCPGGQIPLSQTVDIVVQFLRTNPAVRHLGARTLAAKALADAFPCRGR